MFRIPVSCLFPPPPRLPCDLVQFTRMRKEYVPLYAEHLRVVGSSGPDSAEPRLPKAIQDLDWQLPEQTILMFRCALTAGPAIPGAPAVALHALCTTAIF